MISWGIVTVVTGCVHTAHQFYAVRFVLGAAEASFFPGMIVYLTHWFRLSDRAKAIAWVMAAVPSASVLGSLLAGWLLSIRWFGMAGWRWLFVVEGLPPMILGIVTLFYLTDRPVQARWLSEAERNWISQELEAETTVTKKIRSYTVWQALRDRRVWMLILPYFLSLIGAQANIFWIPTFIKRLSGLPPFGAALLVALLGLLGILGIVLNGWHSDRTGERRWHASIPLLCAGAAYLLTTGLAASPLRFCLSRFATSWPARSSPGSGFRRRSCLRSRVFRRNKTWLRPEEAPAASERYQRVGEALALGLATNW